MEVERRGSYEVVEAAPAGCFASLHWGEPDSGESERRERLDRLATVELGEVGLEWGS